jgi:uncharacterized protein
MTLFNKIILGTAQFGFKYGINNTHGQLSYQEIETILLTAYQNDIKTIDTADAYGRSQNHISVFHKRNLLEKFKIYSKPNISLSKNNIENYLIATLENLNINSIEGYMFHSFSDFKDNLTYYDALLTLKSKGYIKELGISIYTNDEIAYCIENFNFDFIQIPYNVFDNWSVKGELILVAKEKKMDVHVRSIFLQGLFYKNKSELPSFLMPFKKSLIELEEIAIAENISIQALLFSYVLYNKHIDKVLFGVDNLSQLKSNISIINSLIFKESIPRSIDQINLENKELLDIRNWK